MQPPKTILSCVMMMLIFILHANYNQLSSQEKSKIAVKGDVQSIQNQTSTWGFTFRTYFTGIKYDGKIHSVSCTKVGRKQYDVRLSLRDVNLKISRVQIIGNRHEADCGPMSIVLGNRRDLTVKMRVSKNSDGTLTILSSDFALSPDNWSVAAPAWVRAKGIGMTETKVKSGVEVGS